MLSLPPAYGVASGPRRRIFHTVILQQVNLNINLISSAKLCSGDQISANHSAETAKFVKMKIGYFHSPIMEQTETWNVQAHSTYTKLQFASP